MCHLRCTKSLPIYSQLDCSARVDKSFCNYSVRSLRSVQLLFRWHHNTAGYSPYEILYLWPFLEYGIHNATGLNVDIPTVLKHEMWSILFFCTGFKLLYFVSRHIHITNLTTFNIIYTYHYSLVSNCSHQLLLAMIKVAELGLEILRLIWR